MTERRLPKTAVENLVEDLASKANADLSNLDATGQAKFDAKANIALTNSPYTTNRILEIPQDIRLELNNGTLTLKAGSKVYVPNGFEADGTTPKFDEVVIEGNINGGQSGSSSGVFYLVSPNRNDMMSVLLSSMYSDSTEPTGTTYAFWYDTENNRIGQRNTGSSAFTFGYSFPVCVGTIANNLVTSIDQVFNGFGYIGSTVFALPMKGEATTAINQDGTVTKTIWESTTIQTATVSESGVYSMSSSGVLTAGFNEVGYTKLADVTYYDSRIQNVNFYDVGFVATSNASNFSQAGRSYLSGLGMPSGRYIDLTVGASSSQYTAPANGWVSVHASSTGAPQTYIEFVSDTSLEFGTSKQAAFNGVMRLCMPIKKNGIFRLWYNGASFMHFRFYYAEGEN